MAMPNWLSRAAARAADHPWALGAIVATYCEIERCSAAELAARLQCTPETLMWISLCRRPSGDEFAAQVQSIGERFGIPAHELAAIVRRVDAIAALRSSEESSHLIAARDHHEDGRQDE